MIAADRLGPWLADPTRSGVVSDFDGTLSPIVADPERAAPLSGVVDTLAALARRYRVVGVISGRPASYLLDRLGDARGVLLSGLYGLESASDGVVKVPPDAERWRAVIDEVAAAADREAPRGVFVERKGLSVVLHVRRAPEHAEWVSRWAERQAAHCDLVAHPGKLSVELLPPLAFDKGVALSAMAAGLHAVCFLGDDVGDLPAFDALDRLAAAGATTLAVAVRSDESPRELIARADHVVDGPPGALALLRALLGRPTLTEADGR